MNKYCLFYKQSELRVGILRETAKKNRFEVTPAQGNALIISGADIEYSWATNYKISAADDKALIAEIEQRMKTREFDLATIWELTEKGGSMSFAEFAVDFTESDDPIPETAELFYAIKSEGIYFKLRKDEIQARTEAEVDQLRLARERKQSNENKAAKWKNWARDLARGEQISGVDSSDKDWADFVTLIDEVAIDRNHKLREFIELFGQHLAKVSEAEFDDFVLRILAAIGKPVSWGKLQVLKSAGPDFLTPEQLPDIETEPAAAPNETEIFTVDGKETKDFDDALSIRMVGSEIELCVYISDLSVYADMSHPLYSVAKERLQSLYTPLRNYPMFPEELSEQTFSLIQGKVRPVMVFRFKFDSAGALLQKNIEQEIRQIDANRTYEELDEKLDTADDPRWDALLKVSAKLRERRLANGAVMMRRNEVKLDLSDPAAIQIIQSDSRSPARLIIEELAVLVNQTAGEMLKESPAFFRVQDEPNQRRAEPIVPAGNNAAESTKIADIAKPEELEKPNELAGTEESAKTPEDELDIAEDLGADTVSVETQSKLSKAFPGLFLFSDGPLPALKPARVSILPGRHFGLGVDVYAQISSPIRRFTDLHNQIILAAILSGNPVNSDQENREELATKAEDQGKVFSALEKKLANYWKYKYLQQNAGQTFELSFRRFLRSGVALVHFPLLDLMHEMPELKKIPETNPFNVTIKSASPRFSKITFG